MSRNSARTGGIAEIRRNRGPPWKRRPQPGADVAAVAVERAESCADAKMGCGGERESEGKRMGTERSFITAPPGNIGGIIFQRKIALLRGAGHPFRLREDMCQKGGDWAMFTVFRAHETVAIKRWPKGVSNLRQSPGKNEQFEHQN